LRAFEHALFIGGATTALLAGVATAELGLGPVRQAVAAQEAPSLDIASDVDAQQPIQADVSSDPQALPPAVMTPVSASIPPKPPAEPAPKSEGDVQEPDDNAPPADQDRAPRLQADRPSEEVAQADIYDDQDRDTPAPAVNSAAEDIPPPPRS
jgi:hypothetical protein